MMTYNIIFAILLTLILCVQVFLLVDLVKFMKIYERKKTKENNINVKSDMELLEMIKKLTTETCIVSLRNFYNTHDTKLLSEGNIKQLMKDISNEVKNGVNFDQIDFSKSTITKSFYENYIIEITLYTIDSLMEKEMLS